LLKRLDFSNTIGRDNQLLRILSNPRLWDETALKDPTAVRTLAKLMVHADSPAPLRTMAVRALGAAGPAAREAVPGLVSLLAADEPANRAAVREALGKIDPDWRKRPENARAIPVLLVRLSRLPGKEADDLIGALGELQLADVDALVGVLTAGVNPSKE